MRPLSKVEEGVVRIASGDLGGEISIDAKSHNEIDVLAEHVNKAAGGMKQQVEKIRITTDGVAKAASGVLVATNRLSGAVDELTSSSSEVGNGIKPFQFPLTISQILPVFLSSGLKGL